MRSKFEAKIAKQLKAAKIKYEYEPFSLDYYVPVPNHICLKCNSDLIIKPRKYVPDFVIGDTIIEAKGIFNSQERIKARSLHIQLVKWDFRMVFMYDNWITKKHKSKYSDWCEKNGVTYAIGKIPKEWIEEIRSNHGKT